MPMKILLVFIRQAGYPHTQIEPQQFPCLFAESLRNQYFAYCIHRNKADVESRIQLGCQQKAIKNVKPLGIILAIGPRLDMTRTEQLRHSKSGDGTATVPILQQPPAENVLANALNDEAFHFC